MFPDAKLMQFAKVPRLGQVKTRLQPALDEQGALALHCELTRRVFEHFHQANLCEFALWWSCESSHRFCEELTSRSSCNVRVQTGDDLGQRMANAMRDTLRQNKYAIIIGSDCPVMEKVYVESAIQALVNGAEVVVGPAEDGGYVLIGAAREVPELFDGIDWGSDEVFTQTVARLNALACRWQRLPTLWDVDRPEDLQRYEALGYV